MSTVLREQEQKSEKTNGKQELSNPRKEFLYIDVRTPQEFEGVHISGARNIPLPDLHTYVDELKTLSQERSIMLVCRTQNRVKIAYEYLTNNGLTNCEILEGGITAWIDEGKPVIKGQQRISLEGQVRAIAGGVILIGIGLGFTVHSGFFLLPAIVGAGLLHAGLTDSCLMGMLLSRLPMNRIGNSRSVSGKKGDSL
ncbi:MAG: sulfurtransferase [Nitrospirota bacterium]|nr:MAG: sulfurtransferase [Nitrospirota bacterium]